MVMNRSQSAKAGVPLQFFDPRRGGVAFKTQPVESGSFGQPQRFNYFTMLWIQEGQGCFCVDLEEHAFQAPALLFANPYQTFFLRPESEVTGTGLQFHANFLCIETYHEEIGCNGVLFNDVYGLPVVQAGASQAAEFALLSRQIEDELNTAGLAHSEILLSYLKVFLIKATRTKLAGQKQSAKAATGQMPPLLERLIELIETHYQSQLGPLDYAARLHITPKALGRLVKTHFGKSLTLLIRERTLKHAKWQLLHTRQPVKEVAAGLGFADEFYFSRLFKRSTGLSPSAFREFETAIRGGRNLSMQ